ncbi:hypothetical protein OPQ81_002791 [Rhizoctonia solani]|nr:hypothetical protein OPQ81_002791 [Rhizoctonia solani]
MATQIPQTSQAQENIYNPPMLPTHLVTTYNLKPIVGHPKDEDIKLIHAAITAVNAEAQVPRLYNPDLLLQLSQHLFSVQMAIYKKDYPQFLSPADNTYVPPSLPAHIPELEPVGGSPSNEQLKAAQQAVRAADNLSTSPLFDPDLNMKLSQHLFNLQFARYIQDSVLGRFGSKWEESKPAPSTTPGSLGDLSTPRINPDIPAQPEVIRTDVTDTATANNECSTLLGMEVQLEKGVNDIKKLMSESKGVLENMNRVLIAIQRNQVTAGEWDKYNYAHVNPVNQQGVTAVECGLPQIRYHYYKCGYHILEHLKLSQMVGYLKFFNIGAELIEGDGEPQLKGGMEIQAESLILKELGLAY